MTERRIRVKIDPMGNPTIEAEGFAGQGCVDATAAIEKALSGGGDVTREFKPEFNESDTGQETEEHQFGW